MTGEIGLTHWLTSHKDIPARDLELLLFHVADVTKATLLTNPEQNLAPAVRQRLDRCAEQLATGYPLAYVLGHWEFWGLELIVNPTVLIPRPETETLVEFILAHAAQHASVLDIGTGTGAIAIAVKNERPDLQLAASDNHADALTTARCNATRHGCDIEFIQSNWFSTLQGRWDWIVSNPPYVADSDPHLAALHHEPIHALTGGSDGLRDIRTIIGQAAAHLNPGGTLALEHGYDQAEAVTELMNAHGFTAVASINDLARIPRVTHGRLHGSTSE